MAAGNTIDRQYPAHKITPKLTSEELAAQVAAFEAANGVVETSPIFVRGKNIACCRDSCNKTAPFKKDGTGRQDYCSLKCAQIAKSKNGWSARVKNG